MKNYEENDLERNRSKLISQLSLLQELIPDPEAQHVGFSLASASLRPEISAARVEVTPLLFLVDLEYTVPDLNVRDDAAITSLERLGFFKYDNEKFDNGTVVHFALDLRRADMDTFSEIKFLKGVIKNGHL